MLALPIVPRHEADGLLLIFLTAVEDWQEEAIVDHLSNTYDGYAEVEGRPPSNPSSELPALKWIRWTRESEGSRIDAYDLCVQARTEGWDHVLFVNEDSLAGAEEWLENRDESLVLAFWTDDGPIEASRVTMKERVNFTSPSPVEVLRRARKESGMKQLEGLSDRGNWEVLRNPQDDAFNVGGGKTHGGISHGRGTEAHEGLGRVMLDPARPLLVDTVATPRTEMLDAWKVAHGLQIELHDWPHEAPATSSNVFRFMKETRDANGSPYAWLVFFLETLSIDSKTVSVALYHKSMTTHAERVLLKRVPWERVGDIWISVIANPRSRAQLFDRLPSEDVVQILNPAAPPCKRNKFQDAEEYGAEESACLLVWATTSLTATEEQSISDELRELDDWDDGEDDGEDEAAEKPFIIVPWEPDTDFTHADMITIYKEAGKINRDYTPIFVDRRSLEDGTVILTDWKENVEDDDDPRDLRDALKGSTGLMTGRTPGRRAAIAWANLFVSNLPFEEVAEDVRILRAKDTGTGDTGPTAKL